MPTKLFFDKLFTNIALPLWFLASSMANVLVFEILTIYVLVSRLLAYVSIFLILKTSIKANFLTIFYKNKTYLLLKVLKVVFTFQNQCFGFVYATLTKPLVVNYSNVL